MSDSALTTDRFANSRRSDGVRPGDVIGGKYCVRTVLGRDRGLLLDAIHTETDHRVVVKLLPAGQGDEKEIERFRREGRTLAKLESEHVARIIDVGSEPDGSFYLVRQYLEGVDLASHLRHSGPLPLADAVLLIAQAAEAVAEAHSHGIILRELGPSHLFLSQRAGGAPQLKVIDFGTAKPKGAAVPEGAGVELTATAMFGISPYASPELVRKAKNVDLRMDVWSLGAIFYEMLTGRPPFAGETATLMLQIIKEDVVPVSHLRSDVPPELDQIISWAMAKDVDARFRNVHAFVHALLRYASVEAQLLIERVGQITRAAKARRQGANNDVATRAPVFATVMSQPAPTPPPMAAHPAVMIAPAVAQPPVMMPPPPPRLPPVIAPPMAQSAVVAAPATAQPAVVAAPPVEASAPAVPEAPPPARVEEVVVAAVAPTPPPELPRPVPAAKPKRERGGVYNVLAFMSGSIPVLLGAMAIKYVQPTFAAKPVSTEQAHATIEASAAPSPAKEGTADAAKDAAAVPAKECAAPTAEAKEPSAAVAAKEPEAKEAAKEQDAPAPHANDTVLASTARATDGAHATKPAAVRSKSAASKRPATASKQAKADADEELPDAAGDAKEAASDADGGKGTLFAVATGGSCAFSVNGSAKGTSSSLKLSLPAGTYSVNCKFPNAESVSKSVTVKDGQSAFATFKGQGSS